MKTLVLYISFIVSAFTAAAQTPSERVNPKREEKIEALYIAYITKEMQLTPDEAQKFWPVHKQYDTELRAIAVNNPNELDRQQAVLNVKKKYQPLFARIIGNERSNNFYRLDAEFRKKLVERLKQMKQQRKGNFRGGMKRENALDN